MNVRKSLCSNMMRHEPDGISVIPAGRIPVSPEDSWAGLLSWGREMLSVLGPREAQTSAEYLLEEVSGLKRWQADFKAAERPEAGVVEQYRIWVERRRQRVPAAYVTGKAFFREEALAVGPGCLVPRPETELLVEAVIQGSAFDVSKKFEFLDLGTGSGAIAISLLRFFPNASAIMADISSDALRIASRNAEHYGLTGRFRVVQTDFFSAFLTENAQKTWPVIVSNPPYLSAADWQAIEPELLHEPRLALDGGLDGLDAYRLIAREAGHFLDEQGKLFLEVGQGQSCAVSGLLAEQRFTDIHILKDFSGIDRIVTASSPPRP